MQFPNKIHRFCHPQQANNTNYEFLCRTNEERKLSIIANLLHHRFFGRNSDGT